MEDLDNRILNTLTVTMEEFMEFFRTKKFTFSLILMMDCGTSVMNETLTSIQTIKSPPPP
jgi:hypothetical protein